MGPQWAAVRMVLVVAEFAKAYSWIADAGVTAIFSSSLEIIYKKLKTEGNFPRFCTS